MRYVALLRGINVGGKTLIKMGELKTCIEALGLDSVSTYIASGNVLFESEEADGVVLDRASYERIVDSIPKSWVGDASVRANIAFVRRDIDAKQVIRELEPDPEIEEVKAVSGAILWATKRSALNRSVMRRLIGGKTYRQLTVRNLNTTLKLRELLAG